jgi:signal transduction histidine kinase
LVDNQTYQENIKVSTNFPVDGMHVHGDDQQIHQVFLNLVLNAIESMKGSGGGHLALRAVPGHMLVRKNGMRTPSQMECIKITVTDTGSGIPRDRIPELFTPFFTTKNDGSGLGLAVVHGIVTEHGGEIDVTSDLNRGTTFTLTLPVAPDLATAKTE